MMLTFSGHTRHLRRLISRSSRFLLGPSPSPFAPFLSSATLEISWWGVGSSRPGGVPRTTPLWTLTAAQPALTYHKPPVDKPLQDCLILLGIIKLFRGKKTKEAWITQSPTPRSLAPWQCACLSVMPTEAGGVCLTAKRKSEDGVRGVNLQRRLCTRPSGVNRGALEQRRAEKTLRKRNLQMKRECRAPNPTTCTAPQD